MSAELGFQRSQNLAGANKAIAFKLATLVDVHWSTSGNVVLMTLLGASARCSVRSRAASSS